MYINNKIIRIFISTYIAILLYYIVIYIIIGVIDGRYSDVFRMMYLMALFRFFIVAPSMALITILINRWLTKKENRTKNKTIIKILFSVIIIYTLLYLAKIITYL
jgi:hypothetical protein